MNSFITGLQFLTRIRLYKQCCWEPDIIGKSVKYFPLIGMILGAVYAGVDYLLHPFLPRQVLAAVLLVLTLIMTGGIHWDGLMDTADGLWGGRNREHALEIMKDSRVGAGGVMIFGLTLLLKWVLLVSLSDEFRREALLLMPILGRWAMVLAITSFPYARQEGIGKAFAERSGYKDLLIASIFTVIVCWIWASSWLPILTVGMLTFCFGMYVKSHLGGLTGDIYGAVSEYGEIVTLFVILLYV